MAQPKIDKKKLEQVRDRLIAALARARVEADEDPAAGGSLRRIRFELLAADDGRRSLPGQLLCASGERLQAGFARAAGALEVTLEALGAPSIQRLRERMARLISADGQVDYAFRFDHRGRARLSLSAAPEIEASLAYGFDVEIVDDALA